LRRRNEGSLFDRKNQNSLDLLDVIDVVSSHVPAMYANRGVSTFGIPTR
jgi:hypothetical protein